MARPSDVDLAGLRRPRAGGLDDLEAPDSRWSIASGRGGAHEAEPVGELVGRGRCLLGRRFRSPPKISGSSPAQARAASAARRMSGSASWSGPLAWRFETQRPGRQSDEIHLAALRTPAEEELPPLPQADRDCAPGQGQVRAAAPGPHEVGVPAGQRAADRGEPVAGGEREVRLVLRRRAARGAAQRGGHSWRSATSQVAAARSSAASRSRSRFTCRCVSSRSVVPRSRERHVKRAGRAGSRDR